VTLGKEFNLIFLLCPHLKNLEKLMAIKKIRATNELANKRTELAIERTSIAKERTELSINRTIMAADRTLMAWIRTGLSVLSFGFAIYKFLLYLKESLLQSAVKAEGPRHLGISLISLGTICMIFGLIEYYMMFKRLSKHCDCKPWSPVFFIGIISTFLGLFLLFSIIFNERIFCI